MISNRCLIEIFSLKKTKIQINNLIEREYHEKFKRIYWWGNRS